MLDLRKKLFDVEHALMMHADGYVTLPAAWIYETDRLKEVEEVAKRCHIYLVGHTPRICLDDVQQTDRIVTLKLTVGKDSVEISAELPDGTSLVTGDGSFRFVCEDGDEYSLSDPEIAQAIRQVHPVHFNVLYIGQAYGKAGERAALDRLEKHETLQKIALQAGAPPGVNDHVKLTGFRAVRSLKADQPRLFVRAASGRRTWSALRGDGRQDSTLVSGRGQEHQRDCQAAWGVSQHGQEVSA